MKIVCTVYELKLISTAKIQIHDVYVNKIFVIVVAIVQQTYVECLTSTNWLSSYSEYKINKRSLYSGRSVDRIASE